VGTSARERERDERFMAEALALARLGAGRVSPNPLVGAVVVRDGRIAGRGYHAAFGGPHAESAALADAGEKARGADLYVSLEPCNHLGKTPPCTEAILRAGVTRLVCALADPNPLVRGGGAERLRAAGVAVELGPMEEDARRLNEAYLKHVRTGLPFVELKIAASLDGRIAAAGGRSRWITGEEARDAVQGWRAAASGIVVGAGTVRADDPALTVRDGSGVRPRRIVVSSRLDLTLDRRVFRDGEAPTVVATTTDAPAEAERALVERGAEVWRMRAADDGRVSVLALLERCGAEGMNRLLVEGGGALATAFLAAGCVDRIRLFVAPVILGGDGVAWAGPLGVTDPSDGLRLDEVEFSRFGDDLLVTGVPRAAGAREAEE